MLRLWTSCEDGIQCPAMRLKNSMRTASLFLFLLFFAGTATAQKPSPNDLVVINNVSVVDVESGEVRADQTVILERNRIASVGPSKSMKYPRNAPSLNGHGYFLIPGLWDMHVHLVFGDWFPGAQDITLPLLVANGVTGVRDMGSELEIVQGWRNKSKPGACWVRESLRRDRCWMVPSH